VATIQLQRHGHSPRTAAPRDVVLATKASMRATPIRVVDIEQHRIASTPNWAQAARSPPRSSRADWRTAQRK